MWEAEQKADDEPFHTLQAAFTTTVSTLVPDFDDRTTQAVLQNQVDLVLREKLMGYKSLSCFRMRHPIFPQYDNWYPLLLQDFDLIFNQEKDVNKYLAGGHVPGLLITAVSASDTSVYVRSRDGVNQTNKLLEKVNEFYPSIAKFELQTAHDAPIKIPIVSGEGFPDYVFIYAETVGRSATYEPINRPKIDSLRIRNNQQDCPLYNDGVMTKWDLYDCTRRNAHEHADLQQLYATTGGGSVKTRRPWHPFIRPTAAEANRLGV